MNINGWSIIENLLLRHKKNQSDLARLLGISPAAITQIKRGDFQLSMESLETILRYLGNVQLIVEELGGGGHFAAAGAQIKDKSSAEMLTALKAAIDKHLK